MGLISMLVGGIMDANKAIKQNQAKNNDTKNTVTVKGLYSIDVPAFLTPTNKLGGDASLQYWNKTLDISFQVIDEPKSEFIEAAKEVDQEIPSIFKGKSMLDKMAMLSITEILDMDRTELECYTEREINGLNAITLNAFQSRTFFKDAVYGSFAFVEGKDTLYQIIILSGGTSISKLADKLEESIMSFKEL